MTPLQTCLNPRQVLGLALRRESRTSLSLVANVEFKKKEIMGLSPRALGSQSTTAKLVASNSSPPPPAVTYKLGFYGAGSLSGYGNLWFREMALNAGVGHLYEHNVGLTARKEFLEAIDTNGNRVITEAEVSNLTLKVCGYSWGGISAIGFAQEFSSAPKTIVVGGSPHNPIEYRLEVKIPVQILLTIDPVEWLNPAGTVPDTVQSFKNYYQERGGYSLFHRVSDGQIRQIGNSFSSLLKGDEIVSQAGSTTQIRMDIGNWGTRIGTPFTIETPPDSAQYSLNALETNHDGMPWLVGEVATNSLQ